MKNYEEAWKALETRERAIDAELRQPGISSEWRNALEAEKRKVKVCKLALIRERKSDGDRDYEAAKPKDASKSNEKKSPSNELDQSQQRQARQGTDHLRELEIRKWAERQRG